MHSRIPKIFIHKDGRFCVTKQDCSLNKSVFCIHRFANSRPVPSHPHCRPSSCQIWTGFFETGLEACSKKTNTFLLPNPLLPCLRTTRRKEFNNMHINNAYLTLWLCLSFLGLDYVLLSCYPTPFLGCVCAVKLYRRAEREKVGGGIQALAFQRSHVTRPQPITGLHAFMTLPLLPKSLPCFLFCQSTSTMATQRALISSPGFHGGSLEMQAEKFTDKMTKCKREANARCHQ